MTTAIIGTGTWGTAMALLLARAGNPVILWGRDAHKIATLATTRVHAGLPDFPLPATIHITADAADLQRADFGLWAVPTQHSTAIARALRPHLSHLPLMSLSKGIEEGTLRRVTDILRDESGCPSVGVCSGPSHAEEVAAGKPACLVAAGSDADVATLVARCHGQALRLYSSTDVVGVEIAGALKNVIAIAAGICDGLNVGDNLKAAVVTRGLAEVRRLGRALGADDATFAGLAGVGDLLTTCYSPHGRNRALGLALARGQSAADYMRTTGTVAEGAYTCRAAMSLGERHGIELPLTSEVASVLWSARPVASAMDALLSRSPKEENA